jgi:hypothetical protein
LKEFVLTNIVKDRVRNSIFKILNAEVINMGWVGNCSSFTSLWSCGWFLSGLGNVLQCGIAKTSPAFSAGAQNVRWGKNLNFLSGRCVVTRVSESLPIFRRTEMLLFTDKLSRE